MTRTYLPPDQGRQISDLVRRIEILERRIPTRLLAPDPVPVAGSPFVTVAASDTPADLAAAATYQCDGTADEVEIQAALDDHRVDSSKAKVVLLPGNFNLSAGIILANQTHLAGCGHDITYLEYSGTGPAIAADPSDDNITVSSLALWASHANGACIWFPSGSDGCSLYDTSVGSPNQLDPPVVVDTAHVWGNVIAGYAASITIYGQSNVFGNQFYGSVLISNADNTVFSSNYVTASTVGALDGIKLIGNGISDVMVANNIIQAANRHGIHLDGASRCSILGNKIRSVGVAANDTYDGIFINNHSDDNTIQMNVVHASAFEHRYACRVNSSNCDTNWITNNRLGAGTSGALSDAGTGTITAAGNL